MRGNLVWDGVKGNGRKVEFEPDANGEYEVVDGGRITQRQNGKTISDDVSDVAVIRYLKAKFVAFKEYDLASRMRDCEKIIMKEKPKKQEKHIIGGWLYEEPPSGKMLNVENTQSAKQEQPQSTLEKDYEILSFKSKYFEDGKDLWLPDINSSNNYPVRRWSRRGDQTYPYTTEEILKNEDYSIFSVKRKSDNEEFSVDEITEQGKIKKFRNAYAAPDRMVIEMYEGNGAIALTHLTKKKDKQVLFTNENKMCGVCGGKKVSIRGRYPDEVEREICPTCAQERLEQINQISQDSYGQAYKNENA